jgi:hypothetical protein
VIKVLALVVVLAASSPILCLTVRAQAVQPAIETPPSPGRVGFEIAAGPAFEVAVAGDRDAQRGLLAAPTLAIRVTSWFDYSIEGHISRHVSPIDGNVVGIIPLAFRVHSGTRTQAHLSGGAGVVWTDLTGLRGVEQRRNFITQIGVGISRLRANGSGVSLEARLFHLSNLGGTPPNLGMEMFTVLVGYRLPR